MPPKQINGPSARVLFIEPGAARRQMLSSGFRSIGISNLIPLRNIPAAFDHLASEPIPPDWIITPLCVDQKVNALHLLQLVLKQPRFRGTRVSFICEERGVWWLHHAFEMGLLSVHPLATDVTNQLTEFTTLFATLERFKGNETLVAAEYLRGHLSSRKMFADQLQLARSLLELYPTDDFVRMRFAGALLADGKIEAAAKQLDDIDSPSEDLRKEISDLRERVETALGNGNTSHAFAQELGVETAIVVDPDEAMANYCKDLLLGMGVRKVESFVDGQAAWEHMSRSAEPDLVIQEWRIPSLPGNVLLQRIRSHGFNRCSVVIFSALVKPADRMILREMGASDVIGKPLMVQQLARVLNAVITQDRKPSSVDAMERTARNAIAAHDLSTAAQTIGKLKKDPKANQGQIKSIEAELAFANGETPKANKLAMEALQIVGEDIFVINLLGKIYMKLRRFDQAIKFFEKADRLSPRNVSRLCDLAVSSVERGDTAGAEKRLNQTRSLDGANEAVAETEAKIAFASGNQEKAKELLETMGDSSEVIAFLNNRAVGLASEQKFTEAAVLYRCALKALPRKLEHLKPIIEYNLGLAHARAGALDEARWHLAEAAKRRDSPIRFKAGDLLQRTDAAVSGKAPLRLKMPTASDAGMNRDATDTPEEIGSDGASLPVASDVKPGDLRCHLIFQTLGSIDPRFMNLISGMPEFRSRVLDYSTGNLKKQA